MTNTITIIMAIVMTNIFCYLDDFMININTITIIMTNIMTNL